MGPLAAVEHFLERLFERQSARLFRTAIRPLQVQRRLERAMEGDRIRHGSRTVVGHRFTVRLAPADLAALQASAPQLASALADSALAFARAHGYTLLDRPAVSLRSDPHVVTGDIVVELGPEGPPSGSGAPSASTDAPLRGDARSASPDGLEPAVPPTVPDHTAVFVVPVHDGPNATIREERPNGSSRSVAFEGRPLTIGRGEDNAIVLRDSRASRHHARIDGRRGSLVLTDIGSTNGSFVNDRRVDSVALGEGDRIRIGTTILIIEAIDGGGGSRSAAPDATSS